jgi:hypothetical protein
MDAWRPFPWDVPQDDDPFAPVEADSDHIFDFSLSDSTPDLPLPELRPFTPISATASPIDFAPRTAPPQRPMRPMPLPRAPHTGPYPAPPPMLRAAPFLVGKLELAAMDQFRPHPRVRPAKPWTSATPSAMRSDQLFAEVCQNPSATLNPASLGFIPVFFWPHREYSFADLVYDFFQRKNNVNGRFLHKLYNALRISTLSGTWAELVGVQWAAPFVIKVNKGQFARLLGLQTIEGGLFHQQGNFRTHGFVELNREQVTAYCPTLDISQVDFDDVRLLIHQPGIFVKNCTEQQLKEMQDKMNEKRR